ncbi:MAG: SHOCT domain-containing protein [Leptospirales bacterium]|nr:SHOCT domain-containing protein [Leptospirales bacterium]
MLAAIGKQLKLIVSILLLASIGCASAFARRETILSGQDIVVSRIEASTYPDASIQKTLPEFRPFPQLTQEQIERILALFAFKDGNQAINVFRHAEVKPVAKQILDAMKRLKPQDRLVVVSKYDKKDVVFNRPERNSMLIWNDAAGLNVVFGTIREDVLDGSDHDRDAWKEIGAISLKRSNSEYDLLPSSFYTAGKISEEKIHPTWAIIPEEKLAALPPVAELAVPSTRQEEKAVPVDLTRKLSELKQAFDQGLITKEEYESKRKEILSKY